MVISQKLAKNKKMELEYIIPQSDHDDGTFPSKQRAKPHSHIARSAWSAHHANPSTQGSKHIDVRYFRVRDFIKNKLLRVIFCRTNVNIADFFTKYRCLLLSDLGLSAAWDLLSRRPTFRPSMRPSTTLRFSKAQDMGHQMLHSLL